MKTRTLINIIVLALLLPNFAKAQEKKQQYQEKKKEINIKKIAFFTEKLELTEEEDQVFWPVYNDFQDKKENCMRENRGKKAPVNYDELSDKELNDLADAEINKGTKMLELRKEYNEKFKKVLPIKKVVRLYEVEREFKKVLLKDLRFERQNKRRFTE